MRRLSLVLGCALIAPMIAPLPAHAHVRGTGNTTAAMRVTAGAPLSVTPVTPRQLVLNNSAAGTLTGTFTNPNGFRRWAKPFQVTITDTGHPSCKANDFTVTFGGLPAAGAAIAPAGTRAWSVGFSTSRPQCRNNTITVTYPATQ
jgi:hypothetical protein